MEEQFSKVARLIGEKSRAKMLWHLLDGRAYTAIELANFADLKKQACSNHLQKLVQEKILIVEKQGRHKYFRLASHEIAQALEGIAFMSRIPSPPKPITKKNIPPKEILFARTCYDHLAGYVGVALKERLLELDWIAPTSIEFYCTDLGNKELHKFGIDITHLNKQKRKFAYPCLDWSERKHHIGGALGAQLLQKMLDLDWVRRKQHTRALLLTSLGRQQLSDKFGIKL